MSVAVDGGYTYNEKGKSVRLEKGAFWPFINYVSAITQVQTSDILQPLVVSCTVSVIGTFITTVPIAR